MCLKVAGQSGLQLCDYQSAQTMISFKDSRRRVNIWLTKMTVAVCHFGGQNKFYKKVFSENHLKNILCLN